MQEQQAKIEETWFERHLLPLETKQGYSLRKERCRLLFGLMNHPKALTGKPVPRHDVPDREVWLSTEDGKIGGYADRIVEADAGYTIIDYKSGTLVDNQADKADLKFEDCHFIQLKLYTALFYWNSNMWPISLRLVGLDGNSINVPFSPEECLALLIRAYQRLLEVNSLIEFIGSDKRLDELASPSPEHCSWCAYRPCCNSYWEQRIRQPDEKWPQDFRGSLLETKTLGNKSILVKIKSTETESTVITVRGLNVERHPALKAPCSELLFFSLLSDGAQNTYHEGALTTVYSAPEG